jgi:hypothetical protein
MISAPVFDVRTDSADARPARVLNAVQLLAASQALGLVTTALLKPHLAASALVTFAEILTEVLFVWLIYLIWIGSNRARITFALLLGLGLPGYIPILLEFFRISAVAGSINLIQSLLQFVALYFLFTEPARGWFKRKITRRLVPQTAIAEDR